VDIHEAIGAAVALLGRSVDKRIMVKTELNAESAAMKGDPAQLQSAFLNLGLNARDAMPDGGTITIRTENVVLAPDYCSDSPFRLEPGKHLYIAVRDTGDGMDREVLERIFDPFFTTKEVGKGTGLGLAAVYGVVDDHHGAIEVQSRKDEGTVFHIYLPVDDSLATPQPESAEELEHGSGCILVVDDEDLVRTTVQGMLEHLGYEVLVAVDGQDGVEVYQQNHDRIDLVLLDAVMPRMRGRECLHTLKAIDPDVKVVVASGFAQGDQASDFVRDGALAFVMKPLTRDALGRIIARAMRGERLV
jgi:CheY-like chemotaxis protein